MSAGGSQKSLRKALGAIKDSTTVNLAKVNSDYKELDVNIVKATNHVERPAKEKHMRAIFAAISATRPRADVAYCIHALARRLLKTHNWAVALKTLIVIHRALREVDPTFQEELINYGRSSNHLLNLSHFKDDSSPNAWDYSAWVRTYALFLEERLECFRVLKYDVETERPRTRELDTPELLEQLPALQQLLYRVLGCQPQGAAVHNFVIRLALSLVASESVKVYKAISEGSLNLVDKFFEMQQHDALKALDIYRRAGQQAERLSEFYEICKSLDIGRGDGFIKIEQPPSSFIQAMEEYVKEAPRVSNVRKDLQSVDGKPKGILAIEHNKEAKLQEKRPPSPPVEPEPEPEPKPKPEPVKAEVHFAERSPDLLGLDDPIQEVSELDQKNATALAIVPISNQPSSTAATSIDGTAGWELALVTAPSSNESVAASSKLAGGLDKLTLDSLYDDAVRRTNQTASYNPWEQGAMMPPQAAPDPFYASNMMAAPHNVQMAAMGQQQQAFMLHQQQQMMMMNPQQQGSNPFGNPYGDGPHPYNSDFNISDGQKDHAAAIEELVPSLTSLRHKIQSYMSEEEFWVIYFILLLPRLNEDDSRLLSTPEIVQVREVLLQKLRNKKYTPTEFSEKENPREPENRNSFEKGCRVDSIERIKNSGETANTMKTENNENCKLSEEHHEDDVCFSDLEDEENDLSGRLSGIRQTQSSGLSSASESGDWIRLHETQGGERKARNRERHSESEGSSDWLTVEDVDF